ncbi:MULTISPECIES: substrate-binding domain-containing protein [unclassified Oceanispirochaeta]|uniref:substrate-binding domain-containing protein n=1 Tax=unclassified Oceanispirochaeta TaxID=2635722 RepID=UPI000E08E7C7|nr:substrate-binding domain-containing protein [Oceanispirochaeta sp. M1]MBF9014626.1 substrate-binding domain-containing protein [Oceanispirochaeta sp. M2]NPD70882.1 sugar ABC transporter substrate-binding protein [Oceanispirochaeta sp. M1]RDG34161.1 sugar ABC transporter substrate-binding protein [Oceanispirochaeta sp. M1]
MKKLMTAALAVLILSTSVFAEGQKDKGEDKIVIAGIVFQDDQFFNVIQKGMQAAADDLGVELLLANSNNKQDKEMELVNTYIARGVDAIVISPLSESASIAPLKRADDKGIKVITYNSPLGADFPVSYVNSSQSELGSGSGKVARGYIDRNLDGEIQVATLAFKSLLPEISDMRVNGFLNEITDLPGVKVVSQQDAWLAEDALAKAGDILTANPDLDIIYAANDGGTVGAVMAVKNAGKDVVVFGIDASEQLANFLKDESNILQATTGQQPFQIGYQSVEFAVKAIKGEPVEETIIVPGMVLDRAEPAGIEKFLVDLKAITN